MKIRHLLTAFAALFLSTTALAAEPSFDPVSEAELRVMIAVLASDDFEGREPGTPGETKTLAYISDAFWKAGLVGGTKSGGWFDAVALRHTIPGPGTLSFSRSGSAVSIDNDGFVAIGDGDAEDLTGLPVVFVGYGVDQDGKAIGNVDGALAIMIGAPPPYDRQRGFTSRKNALYDAGAKAVIALFDDSTRFASIREYFLNGSTKLASLPAATHTVQGGMSTDYARQLLKAADLDLEDLMDAANSGTFVGKPLSLTASLETRTDVRNYTSYNVIAKLPGTNPKAGAVMYTGHWDHLGICRPEGAEDRICNGAVDNASGIAVMIATARRLKAMGPFERDIYFVATTAEELGLLGAYALAENPPLPLSDIVANLNVDTIAIANRGTEVAIIGRGRVPFEADIEQVARSMGRGVQEGDAANAFIQRQDGWALLQKGVPAVMVGGSFADMDLLETFLSGDYHGVNDELTDATPMGGAAEDADLHIALGAYFADPDRYQPQSDD